MIQNIKSFLVNTEENKKKKLCMLSANSENTKVPIEGGIKDGKSTGKNIF